jgi:hypothetical protein
MTKQEVFIPQSYPPAAEAQCDWYEAFADLGGERIKLQVFAMRSMFSGASFHRAYPRATQQAFLEAHELAFVRFGGVFHTLRYDNLTSAVRRILRGYHREEAERFIAFRSHWRFAASFCTPGEGHEKGGVEGEVGYFRRNHWVPVPNAKNLAELNELPSFAAIEDEQRTIHGRTETVAHALAAERERLLPLAAESFDLADASFPVVDRQRCVLVKTSAYSTPLHPGTEAVVRTYSTYVEICPTTPSVIFSPQQRVSGCWTLINCGSVSLPTSVRKRSAPKDSDLRKHRDSCSVRVIPGALTISLRSDTRPLEISIEG